MKNKTVAILSIVAFACFAIAPPLFAQDANVKTVSVYSYAGAPASGTNEIDTITIGGTPTAGSFTITVTGGRTTKAITWSATNATLLANIDAALELLPNIGTGGVTTAEGSLTAGIGTITLTFAGKNTKLDFPALSVTSSLTGTSPTLAVATTTPGVAATFRNAPTGALVVDASTPALYLNTSTTANSPTWTRTGGTFPAAAVADIATADGSDAATTQALANANKAKINDLLAKLRTAGVLTP